MTATGYTGPVTTVADVAGLQAGLDALAAASPDPVDHSLAGWTFDPAIDTQGGTILPTSGLSHIVRIRPTSSAVFNILIYVTVGGVSLTANRCFATLHNDAGAQLGVGAVTADQSVNWATPGLKTMALTTGQGVTAYDWYKVRLWFAGTTGPTLLRAASTDATALNAGLSAPDYRFATADAGMTTPLAGPDTIGSETAAGTAWWVGLS